MLAKNKRVIVMLVHNIVHDNIPGIEGIKKQGTISLNAQLRAITRHINIIRDRVIN